MIKLADRFEPLNDQCAKLIRLFMHFLGCIRYKGAKIQLLDLPGIIEGAKDGKGRGRQVIAVARTASLIFIGTIKGSIDILI